MHDDSNFIIHSCLAGGYPTPTYQWFREDYENDRLTARPIDPLTDGRITTSGGMLIINNPEQVIETNFRELIPLKLTFLHLEQG